MTEKKIFELQVSADEVREHFVSALIKEEAGKVIASMLNATWNDYGTKDKIQKAVQGFVGEVVTELIRTKYAEVIRAQVEQLFSNEVVTKAAENIAAEFVRRMTRDY